MTSCGLTIEGVLKAHRKYKETTGEEWDLLKYHQAMCESFKQ